MKSRFSHYTLKYSSHEGSHTSYTLITRCGMIQFTMSLEHKVMESYHTGLNIVTISHHAGYVILDKVMS